MLPNFARSADCVSIYVREACRGGRSTSYEAQFYHPEHKKSISVGVFYFTREEDMASCEIEAARALDRVAFKFYSDKGWSLDKIQTKLNVRK
jgi:hypothetical protein